MKRSATAGHDYFGRNLFVAILSISEALCDTGLSEPGKKDVAILSISEALCDFTSIVRRNPDDWSQSYLLVKRSATAPAGLTGVVYNVAILSISEALCDNDTAIATSSYDGRNPIY